MSLSKGAAAFGAAGSAEPSGDQEADRGCCGKLHQHEIDHEQETAAVTSRDAGELSSVVQPEAAADGGGRALLQELKRAFTEHGWPYSEVRGAPVLLGELSGPAGRWSFYAQAVEEKDLVLLYSICPQRVPEARRLEVSHFLTRANYGLADGNFELDFEDGEVRYKTVLHVQADELDGLVLKRLLRSNGLRSRRISRRSGRSSQELPSRHPANHGQRREPFLNNHY